DPELDLGLAQSGGSGGDAEVAGERYLAPPAEGEAVDHRDRRLGEGGDLLEESAPFHRCALLEWGPLRELAYIRPRDEGLLPGAGDDDNARGGVVPERIE